MSRHIAVIILSWPKLKVPYEMLHRFPSVEVNRDRNTARKHFGISVVPSKTIVDTFAQSFQCRVQFWGSARHSAAYKNYEVVHLSLLCTAIYKTQRAARKDLKDRGLKWQPPMVAFLQVYINTSDSK